MKRWLSLLLCLAMMLSVTALADDLNLPETPAVAEAAAEEGEALEIALEAEEDDPAEEGEIEEAEEAEEEVLPAQEALEEEAVVEAEPEDASEEEAAATAEEDVTLAEGLDEAELAQIAEEEAALAEEEESETEALPMEEGEEVELPEVAEAPSITISSVPDPEFRRYLKNVTGYTYTIPSSVVGGITEINLNGYDVRDLTYINYFTNLVVLNCSGKSNLTSLNLNGLTKLKELYCQHCSLTSLTLYNLPSLKMLYCSDNKLDILDISTCGELTYLSCFNNPMTQGLQVGYRTNVLKCAQNPTSREKTATYVHYTGSVNGNTVSLYLPYSCRIVASSGAPFTTPVKNLTLSATTAKLGVKEKLTLLAAASDYKAAECTFTSSKKKVAKVSATGVITAKKKGKATITVRTKDGKKVATCVVTVKKAPGKITAKTTKKTVVTGKTFKMKYSLPKGTASRKITFKSSKPSVAKVDANGKVTALKPGSATITVKTFNGKKAKCKVTVNRVYRALLVGQPGIYGDDGSASTRFATDVNMMKKVLKNRKAPQGSYKGNITVLQNIGRTQLRAAINDLAGKARDTDVTLFFVATHGDDKYSGFLAGALATYEGYNSHSFVYMFELASWLKQIPGKVIVIIASCGSGAAITPNGDDGAAKRFNQAVIDAFRAVDEPIQSNTGEFRDSKFYVLTSSDYLQTSWGSELPGNKGDWFVKMIYAGVGTSGSMAADSNHNKTLTMKELKKYIDKRERSARLGPYGNSRQNVQLYPANSGYKFLKR